MDPWLRALSAVACGAVLAVAGWWGWAAWAEARQRAAVADRSALEVVPAGLAAWQDECLAVIAARDREEGLVPGHETAPPATTPPAAAAAAAAEQVARCRDIVTMRPRDWPED